MDLENIWIQAHTCGWHLLEHAVAWNQVLYSYKYVVHAICLYATDPQQVLQFILHFRKKEKLKNIMQQIHNAIVSKDASLVF